MNFFCLLFYINICFSIFNSINHDKKFPFFITNLLISSCCIVPFHGDYFIINEETIANVSHKLTLFKINQAGIFEKLSEDFPKIWISFGTGKICSRGIYQNKEERIIFCSSHESRGICHSYVIKNNRVFLTEIYNRPESTIVDLSQNERVIGLTLNDQLVCRRKCDK